MNSLVYSCERAKATARFVHWFGADLVAGVPTCGSRSLDFQFLLLQILIFTPPLERDTITAPGFVQLVLLQRKQDMAKVQTQAPGTTLENFRDEVRTERGHGKCCRLGTLAGVHKGPHACPAKNLARWERPELEQGNKLSSGNNRTRGSSVCVVTTAVCVGSATTGEVSAARS